MHLGVVHPRLEARGPPFERSPRSCSRVNPRVLRPLTRGPQGQSSPLRTPHGRPGGQGIFPTSRGQAPHGWPMVHHSMATGLPIPRGCCSVFSASPHPLVRNPATSLCPVPRPVTHLGLFPASRAFPFSWGCRAALAPRPSLSRPLLRSSRVYTPPRRQQPCGAGPLVPHPSGDRFVRPERVAPFPRPSLFPVPRPVTHLGLFPASCAFPFSWGCCAALATRPSMSRPLFPSSRVYTPPGRQQPFGAGPLDPHPSGNRFVCLALVARFPPPSVWVVSFFLDLLGALLPGSAPASPGTRAYSPPGHLLFFFCRAPPAAPLLRPFAPSRSPAACSLCALRPQAVLCGFDFFLVCPPPFPLCILPCGTLLPACTHVGTALVIRSRLPSVLVSCPIALLGRGPWRSLAMPGGRPSLASLSSLPSRLSPPLLPPRSVSRPPSYCCSAAPCALRWSSPRQGCISRALTRLSASALSSVLQADLGGLPRYPFGGTPPSSALAGLPPISSLMVGRGGRYGSMRVIGMAFLCARRGVPVCRCWPPASPSSRAALSLGFTRFFFASLFAFIAAHARPACAPCSSLRYPCLTAPYPHPLARHFSPPHVLSAFTLRALYISVPPHCFCRAFTRVCHPCVLPMPLPVVPILFPAVVSHPHPALSVVLLSPILVLCLPSPTLSPSRTPWVHGEGGGRVTCRLDCGPARGRVRRWIGRIRRP